MIRLAIAARLCCVALFAASAAGCLPESLGGDDSEPMAVVILFDNSQSADDPKIASLYTGAFQAIFNAAADGRGAHLAAYLIDDNPLVSTDKLTATIPRQGGNETDVQYERRVRKVSAYATRNIPRLIEAKTRGPGTGILDALSVAQRFFDNHPKSEERYLVLLSDMIEESDRLDGSKIRTPAARASVIEREQEIRRLADLAGVVVYVAGAGVTTKSGQTPESFRAWQDFWIEYFGAAGADLWPARYGSTLSRFPPPE